jgi:lipopolysaccharide transport system ATP-binding protein
VYLNRAVAIEIDYETLTTELSATVSIHLDIMGTCAFVGGARSSIHSRGMHRATCILPANLLNNGTYHVSVYLITDVTNLRVIQRDAISFDVHDAGREEYMGQIIGTVRPSLEWSLVSGGVLG